MADIPHAIVSLSDYEHMAARLLPESVAAHLLGGSGDEVTLARNRSDFDAVPLRQQVLADMRGAHTRISLLGRSYSSPVMLGPVAHQCLFSPAGECDSAMAAAAMETPFVLSTLSSRTIEEVARAGEGREQWFQLYWQGSRPASLALVRRAEAAGFSAIVVTVDAPVNGVRNREQRAGFVLPPHARPANIVSATGQRIDHGHPVFDGLMAQAPTWDDMLWLRDEVRRPLLVKGILTAEDAGKAVTSGFDAIVVSNHGGRTLDGVPSSISVLPVIAACVAGRVPLILDSGIRRGTDVLKAIELGASAVMIGRPYAAALACAGPHGVVHVLKILNDELAVAMALTGRRTLHRSGCDPNTQGAPSQS